MLPNNVVRFFISLCFFITLACSKETESLTPSEDFDTSSMLENWVDNIIIPYHENFLTQAQQMATASKTFALEPKSENLVKLREFFRKSYIDFQGLAMFEISYSMDIKYRSYLNTYPTNTFKINQNISGNDSIDFDSLKSRDQQGFPAIDFLINGLEKDDAEIVKIFRNNANYGNYLNTLCERIVKLSEGVLNQWYNNRDSFVNNSGTSVSSSVNMIANSFIMYYEKYLRSGKIGIPLGLFSLSPLPNQIEALYDKTLPKALLKKALERVRFFFKGQNDLQSANGIGFNSYLDYLNSKTKISKNSLSDIINESFDSSLSAIENLDESFSSQILTSPGILKQVYDQLQAGLISMKIDMVQALSIIIDYRDADGD